MSLWVLQCIERLIVVRNERLQSRDVASVDDPSPVAVAGLWGKIAAISIGAMLFLGLTLWATVWLTIRLL